MSTQPEALRLADALESCSLHIGDAEQAQAAAELRRLHAEVEELLKALGEIAWSNNSKWQSDRARAAIAKAGGEA